MLADKIVNVEPISEGFSKDKKYSVHTYDGKQYFLRIFDFNQYGKMNIEYKALRQLVASDVPVMLPVEIGKLNEKFAMLNEPVINDNMGYIFYEWIIGVPFSQIMPQLSDFEKYLLGIEVGKILEKMHHTSSLNKHGDWYEVYIKRVHDMLARYNKTGIDLPHGSIAIRFFEENKHILKNRPQSFIHGDFSSGYMPVYITSSPPYFKIIDFGNAMFGDPIFDFHKLCLYSTSVPFYAAGVIDGYHSFNIPNYFWELFALYSSIEVLFLTSWAYQVSPKGYKAMARRAKQTISDYFKDMQCVVPSWYDSSLSKLSVQHRNGNVDILKKFLGN